MRRAAAATTSAAGEMADSGRDIAKSAERGAVEQTTVERGTVEGKTYGRVAESVTADFEPPVPQSSTQGSLRWYFTRCSY